MVVLGAGCAESTVVGAVPRLMFASVRWGTMLVCSSLASGGEPSCAVPASLPIADESFTSVAPSTRQNFNASSLSRRWHVGQRFIFSAQSRRSFGAVSSPSFAIKESRKLKVCVTGLNSHPAHQVREARIRAQVVHERFNLQIGNFPGAILETALQPLKCLVLISECDVNYRKSISGYITFSRHLVHLRERFCRFLSFTQCSLSECKIRQYLWIVI